MVVLILSVSLTVMTSSLMTCLRGATYIRDYTQAVWLLDDGLSQSMISPDRGDAFAGGADESAADFRRAFDSKLPSAPQAGDLDGLEAVNVAVEWTAGRNRKKVGTELWVLTPPDGDDDF